MCRTAPGVEDWRILDGGEGIDSLSATSTAPGSRNSGICHRSLLQEQKHKT